MTIARILTTILFISSLATPQLSAMEPRPSASNSLSLPQTYDALSEQFISAAETNQRFPELVQYVMQFLYHSDPTAFAKELWSIVADMKQEVMQTLFDRLIDHPESLLKMALRLKHAQRFSQNIPGDELDVVDFVQNYKKYGVNGMEYNPTILFKQPYLEHVLPLLELLIGEPVTELYLSSNQLTEVPKSIGKLVNLKELYLSSNKLTALPESIGKLVNLKELYLYNNLLTALPVSVGKLENLEKLWLDNNQLSDEIKKQVRQQFSDLGDKLILD